MTFTYTSDFANSLAPQLQLPKGIMKAVAYYNVKATHFVNDPDVTHSQSGYKYTESELKNFWNMVLTHRQKVQELWDKQPREITEDDCF